MFFGNTKLFGRGGDINFYFAKSEKKEPNTKDTSTGKTLRKLMCACLVIVLAIWVTTKLQDASVLDSVGKLVDLVSEVMKFC